MTEHYLSGGKRIEVVVYEPAAAGKYPAVLVLHGANGPVSSFLGEYGQTLADQGYVVAFVHYFDRTGTTAYPSVGAMEKNLPDWIGTIRDAISFLDKNPKVDDGRIALFGVSLGGFLSTSVSSADPRVKAIVDLCGGIPEPLAQHTKRLAPTLILHGDSDMTVPVAQAYQLEAVLKRTHTPYEKEIYPGEGHMLRGVAFDAMARALEFLNEQLRGVALAR